MGKAGWITFFVVIVLLVGGYFVFSGDDSTEKIKEEPEDSIPSFTDGSEGKDGSKIAGTFWREKEIRDVQTDQLFTISEFVGKPILLESFAVWCPTCTKQQNEIKRLHKNFVGDSVVSISLDTDQNENMQKVLDHINENDFNWWYAISPSDMTQSLIDEFGVGIINAPSAPVVLICPDGTARQLGSGVKSAESLLAEIESCTN
jgi:thiol-disulfide isomerase/thioredoxin